MPCLVTQSCLSLCDTMGCSPPGSSVHASFQATILEQVAFPFSRGSSQPRDQTQVSHIAGRFFTTWATREAQEYWSGLPCSPPGDLPSTGIKPRCPTLQADSLASEPPGKPNKVLLPNPNTGHFASNFSPRFLCHNSFPLPQLNSYVFSVSPRSLFFFQLWSNMSWSISLLESTFYHQLC